MFLNAYDLVSPKVQNLVVLYANPVLYAYDLVLYAYVPGMFLCSLELFRVYFVDTMVDCDLSLKYVCAAYGLCFGSFTG